MFYDEKERKALGFTSSLCASALCCHGFTYRQLTCATTRRSRDLGEERVCTEEVLFSRGRRQAYDVLTTLTRGVPGSSEVKNLPANAGDMGSIARWGRPPPRGGHGNPLQCFYLGNPMDREAWWATVHGIEKELDTT